MSFEGNGKKIDDKEKIKIEADAFLPGVLDLFDRSIKVTFYYDESNYFGKYYIKQSDDGKYSYNLEEVKTFVLAGIVTENEKSVVNKSELWSLLGLSNQVRELKFSYHFSKGKFLNTVNRERTLDFFDYVDRMGWYIHVACVDVFYYSIVDIIDSVLESEELLEYAEDEFGGDLRLANNHLKACLYKVLVCRKNETLNLFAKYGFPEIDVKDSVGFCSELVRLFGNRCKVKCSLCQGHF